jgi:outer membrane protein assembly factor BamB
VFVIGERDKRLVALCLDHQSGRLVWDREIVRSRTEVRHHLNTGAASTPCTDGHNLYALFADFGLVAFDAHGKERWREPLGPFTAAWGMASSPIFVDGLVVLQVDGIGSSFIVAYDGKTGRRRWTTKRPSLPHSYATPVLWKGSKKRTEIIAFAPSEIDSYDAMTGELLWSTPSAPGTAVASPILAGDTLITVCYATDQGVPPFDGVLRKRDSNGDGRISRDEFPQIGREAPRSELESRVVLELIGERIGDRDGTVAEEEWREGWLQVNGRREIAGTRLEIGEDGQVIPQLAWRYTRNVPHVPTPIYSDGLVYILSPGGILTTLSANTGEPIKVARLSGALGNYMASPVVADGKLYCVMQEGVIAVVRLGADWELITTRDLGEPCLATPALVGGKMFVRTANSLWCFAADNPSY